MGKTNKKPSKNTKKRISKLSEIDPKEIKAETIPNPAVVGGLKEIGLTKISPLEIPKYLFMHPALPRGIEIKGNRMVTRVDNRLFGNILMNQLNEDEIDNLNLPEDSVLREEGKLKQLRLEAQTYCKGILDNSGGPLFVKKMAVGAYRFGTSFAVLQTNKGEDKVLKFDYQHEIFFGPSTYPLDENGPGWGATPMETRSKLVGKMKIDPTTKKVSKYSQLTKKYPSRKDNNFMDVCDVFVNTRTHPGMKTTSAGPLVPIGKEFDNAQVIQLAFDTLGDEQLGIPLVQFVHLTIKYLLDMERAGAQTMVNFGFNKWKAMTPFKDEKKMKQFGKTLANLQKDSVVILPEGITLENIEPGQTELAKIHPMYMQLISIRLGIPAPLLVQDGTSTNKASLDSQKEDMYEDFRADELVVENTITNGFFKACKVKWRDLSYAELNAIIPVFVFLKPPENLDKEMDRDLKFSLMIRNYTTAAREWFEAGGDPQVVVSIGKKVEVLVLKSVAVDERTLLEHNVPLPKDPTNNKTKEEVEAEKDKGGS